MKKLLTTIAIIATTGSLASAGDWGKAPIGKAPAPYVEPIVPCYDAGFEFAGFAAGVFPDGGDEFLGGGAALSYFYNESLGFEVSYSVLNTDPSEEHVATVNLIYRFVNQDSCVAPYLLAGGGVLTNGRTTGLFDVGAGIDFRLDALGGSSLFVDGTYNWVDEGEDFVLARAGFRIPF